MRVIEINENAPAEILNITSERELDEYLKANCGEFLSEIGDKKLYRGMNGVGHSTLLLTSPTDRLPKDSIYETQKLIDRALKNSGFKALRSNSIFCTGNKITAQSYGSVKIIYPLNGFSFTWARNVKDMFAFVLDHPEVWGSKDLIALFGFSNENLAEAINSNNEIYIHGKYVMVDRNQWLEWGRYK